MGPVFLKGAVVTLRPLERQSDFALCWQWINDPGIREWLASFLPVTEREEEQFFSRERPNDFLLAIVTGGQEPRHIGNIGAHRIHLADRTAELGILIGEPDEWGKGYGTDAVLTLARYLFHELGLVKLVWQALSPNERSIRLAKRCGFEVEAVLKEEKFRHGRRVDVVRLAMFRSQFEAAWESHQERMRNGGGAVKASG
ncbi:MAG: GNAT family N-acetyltransferase [Candidatus Sungbacteria bacterium]|uniref:GNAT family N-acetyltransferase n=1 Tax=Candidatus Sungiibacteriota bacterium TaxID=2750080 RepID=A0A932YYC8_9BACT|nr:GNAT family N-acetyltransferase [Candidatus Sungbacteria bacterium]